ncbi:MAG: FAD:protein FMN transferase [Candidatus Eisenbacteria bacterium]|nr:FAD:protein FMN transferase [Candidatus Eisenbacteria bacterium]
MNVRFAGNAAMHALFAALLAAGCGGREAVREEWETMGTWARVEIHGVDAERGREGVAAVRAVFDSVTALMNAWDPSSEIGRLNDAPAGVPFPLSPWLDECLARAEDVGAASGGAFDPTADPLMRLWGFYRREGRLPSQAEIDSARALLGGYRHDRAGRAVIKEREGVRFDLGGIAKGFAVDRASERLRALGVPGALIDLGGNLYCLGAPPGKDRWRVGIRNPLDPGALFAAVETAEGAVATSGSYERFVTIDGRRYGHIMNPATGRPAEGSLSATVLTPDATLGDALSTALFVLGPARAKEVLAESYPGVDAILVLPADSDGEPHRVFLTGRLKGRVTLLPGMETLFVLL